MAWRGLAEEQDVPLSGPMRVILPRSTVREDDKEEGRVSRGGIGRMRGGVVRRMHRQMRAATWGSRTLRWKGRGDLI